MNATLTTILIIIGIGALTTGLYLLIKSDGKGKDGEMIAGGIICVIIGIAITIFATYSLSIGRANGIFNLQSNIVYQVRYVERYGNHYTILLRMPNEELILYSLITKPPESEMIIKKGEKLVSFTPQPKTNKGDL